MNYFDFDHLRFAVELLLISAYLSFSILILIHRWIARFIGLHSFTQDTTFATLSLLFFLIFILSFLRWEFLDPEMMDGAYRYHTHTMLFLSMLAMPVTYYCMKKKFEYDRADRVMWITSLSLFCVDFICLFSIRYDLVHSQLFWTCCFFVIFPAILILFISLIILYFRTFVRDLKVNGASRIDYDEPFLYLAILLLSITGMFILSVKAPIHYCSVIFVYFLVVNTTLFSRTMAMQRRSLSEDLNGIASGGTNTIFSLYGESDLKERLVKYFEEEKPYLRKDLSLNEVALYLYTNKTYLSKMINESLQMNFNQLVNSYRVKEAKRIYQAKGNMSMRDLCEMSGFGSMATFSIAFRLFAGSTPADWCKSARLNNSIS